MRAPNTIAELAAALTLSDSALDRRRRMIRMEQGKCTDAQLLAWLKAAYEENRDRVNRLAKGSGYTEHWSRSMGASQRHQLGNLHQEPEAPSDDVVEEYSRNGWDTFEVLKGEELARREARARAERLRQAELELRQTGKSADEYVQAVEAAVEAMRAEAKAA